MKTDAGFSIDRRTLLLLPLAVIGAFYLGRPKSFNIREVEISDARAMIDAGAPVLDVREPDKYAARHIMGALLMPLETLKRSVPEALAYARSLAILVYCGDGVTHGPEATAILNAAGFTGAVNLRPGIEGWEAAGLPMTRQGKAAA